jgi:SH3-like domain-containing protein
MIIAGVACLAVSAGAWAAVGFWPKTRASDASAPDTTASPSQISRYSGLPLPRFVSLKTSRVNARRGPSREHPIAWSFTRKGLPVEITRETENWRLVRDSQGDEGWIYHGLLSGARSALVAPWAGSELLDLKGEPSLRGRVVARLEPGVLAKVERCDGTWCRIEADGFDGWVGQSDLWGVYPGEKLQ